MNIFEPKILALFVFCLAYLLFIFIPHRRTEIAVAGSLLLLAVGAVSPATAFSSINWNVMGIFVGTLIIAEAFISSRGPAWLAEIIVNKAKNTAWSILLICLLTGFISAFVENVATVLIVAPIALALAKKLNFNPIQMMIAIAISSNLQGAATLIGDPPSMLLGGFAKMNFTDFFFYQGRPSIFFAVEIGAIASFLVLYLVFRKHYEKTSLARVEKVNSWIPTIILVGLVFLLAGSSFIDASFSYLAGIICLIAGIITLTWEIFTQRNSLSGRLKALDWESTFFLMGVFVLVGSLTATGWIETLSLLLAGLVGTNILFGYIMIVSISVILSAFIDNVPYLAAMLPVTLLLAARLNIAPQLFLFGLLIGASLGGNITPIGASANIVAISLLKKEGYQVRFGEFVKIGLPFTLVAVSAASLFVWAIWGS